MAVPAMSKCTHFVPGSTKAFKKAAAWFEPASPALLRLVRSQCFGEISFLWYSVTGMCQHNSCTFSPASFKSLQSPSSLVQSPAIECPSAVIIAPVKVESSMSTSVLYFYWVQCMQSASTNLPSASVFPISTVSPLRLVKISEGLQAFQLMEFSTSPMLQVKLIGNFCLTIVWKAASTVIAPNLSMNMSNIPKAKHRKSFTCLDVESSCIEAHSFANKGHPALGIRVAFVAEVHEDWLVDAGSAHCVHQAKTLLGQIITNDFSITEVVLLCKVLGNVAEVFRHALDVSSSVSPFSGLVSGFGQVDQQLSLGHSLLDGDDIRRRVDLLSAEEVSRGEKI